jgi:anti-sigma factor RsiW
MNCKKVMKLLPLYMSDDIDASEVEGVKEHLNTCLGCFREYQDHLRARRSLRHLAFRPDLGPVMEGFSDEVMLKIADRSQGPAAPIPRVTYRLVPRLLAAAALILALVSGGFYLFSGPQAPPLDPDVALEDRYMPHDSSDILEVGEFQPVFFVDSEGTMPPADGQERKYPDLEPLPRMPQHFPVARPVNVKNRNF